MVSGKGFCGFRGLGCGVAWIWTSGFGMRTRDGKGEKEGYGEGEGEGGTLHACMCAWEISIYSEKPEKKENGKMMLHEKEGRLIINNVPKFCTLLSCFCLLEGLDCCALLGCLHR